MKARKEKRKPVQVDEPADEGRVATSTAVAEKAKDRKAVRDEFEQQFPEQKI